MRINIELVRKREVKDRGLLTEHVVLSVNDLHYSSHMPEASIIGEEVRYRQLEQAVVLRELYRLQALEREKRDKLGAINDHH